MDMHQIRNQLGIIRIQCESFVMDSEGGLLKDKSVEEQNAMALAILKNVILKVDQIAKHLALDHPSDTLPLL